MYKIYSDDHLLYADGSNIYKVISPKLELELNKAGKLSFSIYPNHPEYSSLNKLKSIVTVYQDNDLVFRGRVLNSEKGWRNEQKITCEGELAFLNDSLVHPYDYQTNGQISIKELFSYFIDEHNSQVDDVKRFKVGTVDVSDGDTSNTDNLISRANSDYSSTWEAITKKLIESLGGYLIVRHEEDGNYIDYLASINVLSTQTVEFGKNLTDVLLTTKGEDLYTGIIPLGSKDEKTGKRITIKEVNNDIDYVINEKQAERYGRIFKTVVWDNVTTPQILLDKANELKTSLGMLTETIELNAVDISPLFTDINSFRIGSKVRVISRYHAINSIFMIEKLTIDIMKPESNKLTLGATRKSYTEQQADITSSEITSISQKIDSTIIQIGSIIKGGSKILWKGNQRMAASQSISFIESVSKQTNGIVLVFSRTNDDFGFNSFFIPKKVIENNDGKQYTFFLTEQGTNGLVGTNYLSIYDNRIMGHKGNMERGISSNGIVFNNSGFSLKYVIGV